MIKAKVNLAALQHVVREMPKKDGTKTKVIVIPIVENSLFLSEKGNVYLDIVGFDTDPIKRRDPEDTHMLVQSLSKEQREKGEKGPILGNLQAVTAQGGEQKPAATADIAADASGAGDDLPF